MTEELKPCPCCGCEDLQSDESYVMCEFCGLMISGIDAPGGDFKNAWNQRAEHNRIMAATTPADSRVVPVELLERWADKLEDSDRNGYGWEDALAAELRELLGVKP